MLLWKNYAAIMRAWKRTIKAMVAGLWLTALLTTLGLEVATAAPPVDAKSDALIRGKLVEYPWFNDVYQECLAGNGRKCFTLADGFKTYSPDVANALWRISCNLNEGAGCYNLGQAYAAGRAVPKSQAQANLFITKACSLHYSLACPAAPETFAARSNRPGDQLLSGAVPADGYSRANTCQMAIDGHKEVLGQAYSPAQCAVAVYNRKGGRCPVGNVTYEARLYHGLSQRIVMTATGATTTRYNNNVAYPLKTGIPCYQAAEAGLSFLRQRGAMFIASDLAMLRERSAERPRPAPLVECITKYNSAGVEAGRECHNISPFQGPVEPDMQAYFVKNIGKSPITFGLNCLDQLGMARHDRGSYTLRPGEEKSIDGSYDKGEGRCICPPSAPMAQI